VNFQVELVVVNRKKIQGNCGGKTDRCFSGAETNFDEILLHIGCQSASNECRPQIYFFMTLQKLKLRSSRRKAKTLENLRVIFWRI
jgi:hypothetical protein